MKTLIFEGAGWEKAESGVVSGVGNCRIRTKLRNNKGRLIYLELGGWIHSGKRVPDWAKNYKVVGYVIHCCYSDTIWDSGHSEDLCNIEGMSFEYSKESILQFVNKYLECSFEDMKVINDGSVYVFGSSEPLCDSSNGKFEPYKDVEVSIDVLDGVQPIWEFEKIRTACYEVGYDFVRNQTSLAKWIENRSPFEKEELKKHRYLAKLSWNEKSIIKRIEISSYTGHFVTMALGPSNLQAVISEILFQARERERNPV